MRLAVLTPDPDGPVTRHRIRALEPALAEAGFGDVTYVGIPKRTWPRLSLFRTLARADLVVLQRKLFTRAELALLRGSVRRLVFDIDDAVMYRDPFSRRPAKSAVRLRRFRRTVRAANLVTAGNDALCDEVRAAAPFVTTLRAPTPIDTAHYQPAAPVAAPRVGWIGSRATRPYLQPLAPVLRSVAADVPGFAFAVMADAPPTEADGFGGVPLEFTPWSQGAERTFLQSLAVGVMPLTDDPFSRGKCGFKLLQFMASGVAFVASPVGVNVDLADGGRAGLLATGAEQWEAALRRLLSAPEERARLAGHGHGLAERAWSVRALAGPFAAALAECAREGAA